MFVALDQTTAQWDGLSGQFCVMLAIRAQMKDIHQFVGEGWFLREDNI